MIDTSDLGRPIKGPSALGSDPRRFWHLTQTMAVMDFKLRFFGSALGYVWQLMRPLLLFGVLYMLFAVVLKLDDAPYYPEALLLGLVLFTFFADSTRGAVGSLVARESLVRKIEFPRLAVPLSVVLTALFNLGLNLLPVFVFLLVDGGTPRWTWLELPFLILLLAALGTGLAMLLSSLFVRYRDIDPIWEIVMQLLFYASPIFYVIQTVQDHSESLAKAFMYSPFAAIIQQARHAMLGPGHPSAANVMGSDVLLLVPAGICVAVLVLGYVVFDRRAPLIAEEL
ncbi:MAG TPA: ABC transporter permease [Solirubrobacteraceae bacterium]|nr:ABC transporter permease [Solirubrobacteraceae bacterium]